MLCYAYGLEQTQFKRSGYIRDLHLQSVTSLLPGFLLVASLFLNKMGASKIKEGAAKVTD